MKLTMTRMQLYFLRDAYMDERHDEYGWNRKTCQRHRGRSPSDCYHFEMRRDRPGNSVGGSGMGLFLTILMPGRWSDKIDIESRNSLS